jgi:hypothetical protein
MPSKMVLMNIRQSTCPKSIHKLFLVGEDEDFEPRSELDIYLAERKVQCGSLMYWQANITRFTLSARMARESNWKR